MQRRLLGEVWSWKGLAGSGVGKAGKAFGDVRGRARSAGPDQERPSPSRGRRDEHQINKTKEREEFLVATTLLLLSPFLLLHHLSLIQNPVVNSILRSLYHCIACSALLFVNINIARPSIPNHLTARLFLDSGLPTRLQAENKDPFPKHHAPPNNGSLLITEILAISKSSIYSIRCKRN